MTDNQSQAAEYLHSIPVHYPGFHPRRVYPLPLQSKAQLHIEDYVDDVLKSNKEALIAAGCRTEMGHLLKSVRFVKFMLDAFWWFFLDQLSEYDFEEIVKNAKRNALVSDLEMQVYLFQPKSQAQGAKAPTGGGNSHIQQQQRAAMQSTLVKKKNPEGKPNISVTKAEYEAQLPPHLTCFRAKTRGAEEIALIGSPRCSSSNSSGNSVRSMIEGIIEESDLDGGPRQGEDTPFDDDTTTTVKRKIQFREVDADLFSCSLRKESTISAVLRDVEGTSITSGTVKKFSVSLDPHRPATQQQLSRRGMRSEVTASHRPGTTTTAPSLFTPLPPGGEKQPVHKPAVRGVNTTPSEVDRSSSSRASSSRSSSVASSTTAEALTYSKFKISAPPVHKLDPAAQSSVVAREQHMLYTRMCQNYGKVMFQLMATLMTSVKDGLTRLLPDIVAQVLYLSFCSALPYAVYLLDGNFQTQMASVLSYWIGGVRRCNNVRLWPVHQLIGLAARKRATERTRRKSMMMRRKSSLGASHLSAAAEGRHSPPSSRRKSQDQGSGSSSSMFRPQHGCPSPPLSRRGSLIPTTAHQSSTKKASEIASSSNVKSDGLCEFPQLTKQKDASTRKLSTSLEKPGGVSVSFKPVDGESNLTTSMSAGNLEVSLLLSTTPSQGAILLTEKAQGIVTKEKEQFQYELARLKSVHTFSQFHYGTEGAEKGGRKDMKPSTNGGEGGTDFSEAAKGLVKRLQGTYSIGPQKRTVHSIKKELDEHYKLQTPWYGNPLVRVRKKEQLEASKFSLKNWSPLLHRYFLLNGMENTNNSDCMTWTL